MFTPNANPTVRIRAVKFVLLLVVSLPVCIAALSCVTEDDLTADQRVYQLSQQLMCPVCDGQTLDQSQAQLSEDMKAVIRNKIEEGATNAEIRDYFVERYGEIVLASPDVGGFNLIAWVMPAAIFLGGALLVGSAYMNMKRRNRRGTTDASTGQVEEVKDPPAAADPQLDEYLQRADREMTAALGGADTGPRRDTETGSEA